MQKLVYHISVDGTQHPSPWLFFLRTESIPSLPATCESERLAGHGSWTNGCNPPGPLAGAMLFMIPAIRLSWKPPPACFTAFSACSAAGKKKAPGDSTALKMMQSVFLVQPISCNYGPVWLARLLPTDAPFSPAHRCLTLTPARRHGTSPTPSCTHTIYDFLLAFIRWLPHHCRNTLYQLTVQQTRTKACLNPQQTRCRTQWSLY